MTRGSARDLAPPSLRARRFRSPRVRRSAPRRRGRRVFVISDKRRLIVIISIARRNPLRHRISVRDQAEEERREGGGGRPSNRGGEEVVVAAAAEEEEEEVAKERGPGAEEQPMDGRERALSRSKTTAISEGQSARSRRASERASARVIYVQHGSGRRLIRRWSRRL